MNKGNAKNKVFVGLSGGVDSAVSACLLKKNGYDVTGVFIKVWQPDWLPCNWKEERRDAMRVAAYLDIPFITLDLSKEYKADVVDYMIREYTAGRTPNPDVMCNRFVKFGAFLKYAKNEGADFVATGHYARIKSLEERQLDMEKEESKSGGHKDKYRMYAGVDKNKDQSYFLWTLNQNDLPYIKFPVGRYTKDEVRKLALNFGLPNAKKKDSQGLCFVGKIDFKEFLKHYAKPVRGNVLNESGEVIGSHEGSLFFTIGERHGFTIFSKTTNELPYYVVDKDVVQNTITVSNKDQSGHLPVTEKQVRITNVNWVRGEVPEKAFSSTEDFPLLARPRYRAPLERIRLITNGISESVFEFEKPQDTLTAGQSLVIYDGEECLGGGVINY